jgi:hypothetical protein
MVRARKANAAVDAYHKEIGEGYTREVTVDVEGVPRRLDLASKDAQIGVEYKTGKQYASEANRWEIARDQILVKQGWTIQWVFQGSASLPLQQALTKAGITYIFR